MRSLKLLRALSTVGRRDLERAALELREARAELERVETEVQVASQRLVIEQGKADAIRRAEGQRLDSGQATAGDLALGAAWGEHVRQRVRLLELGLETARADLQARRDTELERRAAVHRALERCEGVDDKIRRAILGELAMREDLQEDDAAASFAAAGHGRSA